MKTEQMVFIRRRVWSGQFKLWDCGFQFCSPCGCVLAILSPYEYLLLSSFK